MPKKVINILLFLIAFISGFNVIADNNDSIDVQIDSSAIYYFYSKFDTSAFTELHYIDTSLIDFQERDQIEIDDNFVSSLGNIGLASENIVFKIKNDFGFNFGNDAFDNYLLTNNKVKYYKLYIPYTELFYEMGKRKEQFFSGIHSQNLAKYFNVGLFFRFIHSPGLYIRQSSDDKSFDINTRFQTENERYGVIVNYIHNKINVEENGGIKYDSTFENNTETDRRLIKVNLEDAKNHIKQSEILIHQYYYLSKNTSNINDSIEKVRKRNLFSFGKLSYTFRYKQKSFLYTEGSPLNDFYKNYDIVLDSTSTYDSVATSKLENQIIWSNENLRNLSIYKPFNIYFGLRHVNISLWSENEQKKYNQIISFGNVSFLVFKRFRLSTGMNYAIGGYNDGDFSWKAKLDKIFWKEKKQVGTLSFATNYVLKEPGWFYDHYYSNHFRWDNNFKKYGFGSFEASFQKKNLSAGVVFNNLKNYVYLDTVARPVQYEKSFNVLKAYLKKSFFLGNFYIKNSLVYQNVSNEDVLRLPKFILNTTFSYNLKLFKGAAYIQPGLDVFYNTEYYADEYMPATRSFYLQNDIKTGNYFYADVFINVKIQRTRFFLKYTHFNTHFSGYSYFMVPHYPMRDAEIKFGLSWIFHD